MTGQARVLVVDDSPTMRGLIKAVLRSDPGIDVVGEAGDAMEARSAIKMLNPDVITLDVEMPNMNGLEFLEKIMQLRPMPVIMVSTLTHRGAEASLAALEIGAFDCVGKPLPGDPAPFAQLAETVKAAARSQRHRPDEGSIGQPASSAPAYAAPSDYQPSRKIIGIGASTGGVEALIAVLPNFRPIAPDGDYPAHAGRLHQELRRAAQPPLCPAGQGSRGWRQARDRPDLSGARRRASHGDTNPLAPRCALLEGGPVNGHRPSVDVLFDSIVKLAGAKAVGVILTGMGRDGAAGLLRMRQAGAQTIGQNEKTCVVYGMPRVAQEIGGVGRQLPLNLIGEEILKATTTTSRKDRVA
jgi:two-component system chemotaxis response regulator CheB